MSAARRRGPGPTLLEAAAAGGTIAAVLAPWALGRMLPFNTLTFGEALAFAVVLAALYAGAGAVLGAGGGLLAHLISRGLWRGYLAGVLAAGVPLGAYVARDRLDLVGDPSLRAFIGALVLGAGSLVVARALRGRGGRLVAVSWSLLIVWLLWTAGSGAVSDAPVDPQALDLIRRSPPPAAPLVVLGLDGVEPEILAEMFERDAVPHLQALWERGAHGRLRSMEPTWSPPIWTSIWTGRMPEDHGITFFLSEGSYRLPGADRDVVLPRLLGMKQLGDLLLQPRVVPVSSELRRATAVWEVAGLADLESVLANRLVSWPAQPLRGVELSSRLALGREDLESLAYPDDLAPEALDRVRSAEPVALPGFEHAPWLAIGLGREGELWRMGAELFAERGADLFVAYTHLIDSAQHRYLKYHWPERYRFQPEREDVEGFGRAIEATYRGVDAMIGTVLETVGPGVRVLVVSDHGVEPNRELREDQPEPRGETSMPPAPVDEVSGVHGGAPDGIFCLAGPGVRPGRLTETPHVLDVAPLVLRLLSLPVAMDLERPEQAPLLRQLLIESPSEASVASFEGLLPRRTRSRDSAVDDRILEELRALGYIE